MVTYNLSDILPERVSPIRAFALLTSNPAKEEKTVKQIMGLLDDLIDKYSGIETVYGQAKMDSFMAVKQLYEDRFNESLETYYKIRQWAEESYSLMVEYTPVVTGNLVDSIAFFGTGPADIDIRIDVEELTRYKGRMENIEPYVWSYKDWRNGAEKIRGRGKVKLERGVTYNGEPFDYSVGANQNARPHKWWNGSTKSLKGFKTKIWEIDIKKRLADKYGLDYEIDQYDSNGELI